MDEPKRSKGIDISAINVGNIRRKPRKRMQRPIGDPEKPPELETQSEISAQHDPPVPVQIHQTNDKISDILQPASKIEEQNRSISRHPSSTKSESFPDPKRKKTSTNSLEDLTIRELINTRRSSLKFYNNSEDTSSEVQNSSHARDDAMDSTAKLDQNLSRDKRVSEDHDGSTTSAGGSSSVNPKVRIVNGQIQLDQSSLLISGGNENNNSISSSGSTAENLTVVQDANSRHITSRSFSKKHNTIISADGTQSIAQSSKWSHDQTLTFYKALSVFGTDFETISMFVQFPVDGGKHNLPYSKKSRRQCLLKFKAEERKNRGLIDSILLGKRREIKEIGLGVDKKYYDLMGISQDDNPAPPTPPM